MLVFRTAILCLLFVVVIGQPLTPSSRAQNDDIQHLLDKAEIEALIISYGMAQDKLDTDGYGAVFTEDAQLDVAGDTRQGREEIRAIVEGLIENRDANASASTPAPALYHVISNTDIRIIDDDEATHQSYWQTVRVGTYNVVTVGAMGRYEDVVVKRDLRWQIQSRKIIPFN